ncbi:MAG: cyclopropane-fatty-acyl-phospholipid synthase family protein [bacterium]|nr:cyclopropane-fatty-acyl-phospholipid synthase family protein [bacterium]
MSTTTSTSTASILPRPSRRIRPARRQPSLFQRWAKTAIDRRLEGLVGGPVRIHDDEGTREFGDGRGKAIEVWVRSPRLYARLAREGSLGAGTSWIEGDWECNDLPALLRLLVAQPGFVGPSGRLDSFLARGESALRTLASPLTKNTRGGSRRNISAHYDLGNDFYAAMLDPSMTYSSAIFGFPGEPLESAQTEKYDRLCRQLDLRPSHRLLEIGTGWGGFALHAAKHYGCQVTTTTISAEQRALALERVEAAGLGDRIDVRFDDYRDLTGRYDRLVSIEMIEAVGAEYLDRFVQVCSDRLEPDGVMGLQAIVIADQLYERSKRHVDFIKKYVFPGGFLPSVAAISDRVARVSDFRIQDIHDITADYAETLRRWRANLDERPEAYASVDDSGAFERLWAYYLAYCEAGFEERRIGCVQMTLTKSGWRPGR